MDIVDLYNNVYKVLSNDADILNYLGVGNNASNIQKAKKIQKRAKPQDLLNNLPLIAFYAPPGGRRERLNDAVYTALFVFDVYTSNDVDKAHRIAKRIIDLFEGRLMPFVGIENFESRFVTGHESDSGAADVYCFTVVLEMSVTTEPIVFED